MTKNITCLIIPDVHGRNFWREPVMQALDSGNGPIVFLGDYLDPYPHEHPDTPIEIVREDAIETLKEIIELKKKYPERVVLLLGNHDCTYMVSREICECRTDYLRFREIENIFTSNRELFQLAYEMTVNGKHFIFSHAGIHRQFAIDCFGDTVNEDNVVNLFNDAFREGNYGILTGLGVYSRYRGWSPFDHGSLVWADAREWKLNDPDETWGYNVVGHTMLKQPYIGEYIAFIDTQEAYAINKDGKIEKYHVLEGTEGTN